MGCLCRSMFCLSQVWTLSHRIPYCVTSAPPVAIPPTVTQSLPKHGGKSSKILAKKYVDKRGKNVSPSGMPNNTPARGKEKGKEKMIDFFFESSADYIT